MTNSALGPPIDVRPLLSAERESLIELLANLGDDDWAKQTPCPGWSVHDLAVHVLHDDVRRLSAQRDGHSGAWLPATTRDELADALDTVNNQWVDVVAPNLSPRLTREMLAWTAGPSEAVLAGLDPDAEETTVAWAGPGPHPNWLDVAREFTERWVHQQQIRQAVDQPGLVQPEFLGAVVDTFARALPGALPPRPPGTEVRLSVSAPFRRAWTVRAEAAGWVFTTSRNPPAAEVNLPADTLWRRAVRMASREQVSAEAQDDGDPELVTAVLDIRGAIVPNEGP